MSLRPSGLGADPAVALDLAVVVDRVEGQVAVLEVADLEIALTDLSIPVEEGSCLRLVVTVAEVHEDPEAREVARNSLGAIRHRGTRGDDGGDIQL